MSCFTFDFDLEDDLDESFNVITPQKPPASPSIDKTLVSDGAPEGAIPAEEIPLSTLVRDAIFILLISALTYNQSYRHLGLAAQLSALPGAFSYSPITLPAPAGGSGTSGPAGHTLARRDLFDVRFQLSLSPEPEQPDEQTTAFVDAPADLVPGMYEGGLKTWECALDLAAYLDRDVLNAQAGVTAATAGWRIRGSRVLEVSSSIPSDGECCCCLMRCASCYTILMTCTTCIVWIVRLRDGRAYARPLRSTLCVFGF